MSQGHILTTTATGEQISNIVKKLESALEGEVTGHAIISCLSLVLAMMDPTISSPDLQKGVRDVSQYICLWLDSRTADGPTIKETMN